MDEGYEGREWLERHWKKFSRGDDDGDDDEVVPRTERTNVRVERRKENFLIVSIIALVVSLMMVNVLHSEYCIVDLSRLKQHKESKREFLISYVLN